MCFFCKSLFPRRKIVPLCKGCKINSNRIFKNIIFKSRYYCEAFPKLCWFLFLSVNRRRKSVKFSVIQASQWNGINIDSTGKSSFHFQFFKWHQDRNSLSKLWIYRRPKCETTELRSCRCRLSILVYVFWGKLLNVIPWILHRLFVSASRIFCIY